MRLKSKLFATAVVTSATFAAPASATVTLVTSLAAFEAGTTGIFMTPNPGNYDLTQAVHPTTTSIALSNGQSLGLFNDKAPPALFGYQNAAEVVTTHNGYPFQFVDGFGGELFIPLDLQGNMISNEGFTLCCSLRAVGFEVAPFSSSAGQPSRGVAGGPYNFTMTLSTGQTTTVSLPGGDLDTGTTVSQFFGFYSDIPGSGPSSFTITTTDPNGFVFGNFVNVPEPASVALLLVGLATMAARRRDTAVELRPAGPRRRKSRGHTA